MENINESRNSISIYIQSFTQHMLLKKYTRILHNYFCDEISQNESAKNRKIKNKNTHFLTQKQQRIKKGISKVALC